MKTHLIYGKGEGGYQCPVCNGDTSNFPLTGYLRTFEVCDGCETDKTPHLIEAKWHRECYGRRLLNP